PESVACATSRGPLAQTQDNAAPLLHEAQEVPKQPARCRGCRRFLDSLPKTLPRLGHAQWNPDPPARLGGTTGVLIIRRARGVRLDTPQGDLFLGLQQPRYHWLYVITSRQQNEICYCESSCHPGFSAAAA